MILNLIKKLALIVVLINITSMSMAFAEQPITIQDRRGNYTGTIQRLNNSNLYVQTDKYGRATYNYKVIGSKVFIFDKYGRCIESYSVSKDTH